VDGGTFIAFLLSSCHHRHDSGGHGLEEILLALWIELHADVDRFDSEEIEDELLHSPPPFAGRSLRGRAYPGWSQLGEGAASGEWRGQEEPGDRSGPRRRRCGVPPEDPASRKGSSDDDLGDPPP
jgi:hypothetical protein